MKTKTINTKATTNEDVTLRFYAIAPLGWEGDWATILLSDEDIFSGELVSGEDAFDAIRATLPQTSNPLHFITSEWYGKKVSSKDQRELWEFEDVLEKERWESEEYSHPMFEDTLCYRDGESVPCEIVTDSGVTYAIVPLENEEQRVWW